ncbi:MAG TPA: hypothetical protein VKT81_14835 [Bryobacteraceae bacterium]|nr:hypothetical protein [Bryobacteraceae bacterium]
MTLLGILFACGFNFLVCLLTGKMVLQLAGARLSRLEELFLGFVTGAACLSVIVFALAASGQARRGVFLATGLLLIALAVTRGALRFSGGGGEWPWKLVFAALFVLFGVLYLGNALEPETSPDGLAYHVALVARYLREHRLPAIATNFTANYPEGMEMLFLFAFAFGKHTAAAMVHFLFLLMMPFGMLAYGRRVGSPVAGIIAGLLFFMSPIAGKTGTSAYVDIGLAAAVFAVFLLLEIWRAEGRNALLVPIGVCAGFAYATKYTGGLAIVYAMGAVVLHLWRTRRPILAPVTILAAGWLAIAAPWLLKNAIVIGNPVSPFANALFPNPYLSDWSEKFWLHAQQVRSGVSWSQLPIELTVGGSKLYGVVGPIFLLVPILLFGLRSHTGRRVALGAMLFALPCLAAPETRYWIPAMMFASMGMALVVARWRSLALTLVLIAAITSWPAVLNRYVHPYAWRLGDVDWKAAIRLTPEADYLRSHMTDYDIGLAVDKIVPVGEPIFSFSGIQQAYQSHPVIVEWTSSAGVRASETLRTPFTRILQPTRRWTYQFAPTTARRIRLVQTARSETDRWSITELRVLRAGQDLPRAAAWRLRASSNPWDVQLAFDNSAVTRWTSYAAFRPGMFIEADFGKPETIDQVAVECALDQPGIQMRVDAESAPGVWRKIADRAVESEIAPPDGLRRAAILEVERSGIHWLLMHDLELDRGTRDFFRHQEHWGIQLMATVGPFKLYRLE